MTDSEKTRQKEALNEAMGQILDKDNPHAYSTIAKVGHHLWQFGLFSYIEPAEILTEAYLRALRAIDQGTQIGANGEFGQNRTLSLKVFSCMTYRIL